MTTSTGYRKPVVTPVPLSSRQKSAIRYASRDVGGADRLIKAIEDCGGYERLMRDTRSQEDLQDMLDSFFAERIVAIRNQLRGMGWYDPEPGLPARALHRKITDGRVCMMDATPGVVGAGRNVVGMTIVIRAADKGALRWAQKVELPDSLELLPEEFAALVECWAAQGPWAAVQAHQPKPQPQVEPEASAPAP
jgi:hypothetical protein